MTDDDKALVERLRGTYRKEYAPTVSIAADNSNRLRPFPCLAREVLFNPDGREAAARIEALSVENERLREALVMAFRAIDYHNDTHPYEPMSDFFPMVPQGSKIQSLSDARALQEQSK